MGNRMLIVACAVALPLLGGCRASFSRNTVTSRELELKGTRFSAELKKSETIVRFGRFSLRPRVKLCNVSIRVVYDNNDNGIPGDKGDVTEWLSRQSGEFQGLGARRLRDRAAQQGAHGVLHRGADAAAGRRTTESSRPFS